MTTNDQTCLMLYRSVTRADFEGAAADVGLRRHDTWPGDGARKAYQQVWVNKHRTAAVNYLEDPLIGGAYVALRGDQDEIASLTRELAMRLDLYDQDDAIELAVGARSRDVQVDAIYRVAVVFPKYDPRAFQIFETYATNAPDALLREAAVNAMAYRSWPEFAPLLEKIAANDASTEVRELASQVLPFVRRA